MQHGHYFHIILTAYVTLIMIDLMKILTTAVHSVGDTDTGNCIRLSQIHGPVWAVTQVGVGARVIRIVGVLVTIDSPARIAARVDSRLPGCFFESDVCRKQRA